MLILNKIRIFTTIKFVIFIQTYFNFQLIFKQLAKKFFFNYLLTSKFLSRNFKEIVFTYNKF